MTHFLSHACPEFAEEVIDVFNRYVAGDTTIAKEAFDNLRKNYEAKLQEIQGDVEKEAAAKLVFQDELRRYEALNQHLETELKRLQISETEMVALCEQVRIAEKARREAEQAKAKAQESEAAEKQAHMETRGAMQNLEDDKYETDQKLKGVQKSLDKDNTRPLNIFRDMDDEMIPESNRHDEHRLWYPARHATVDACIYAAHKNQRFFTERVLNEFHRVPYMNRMAKRSIYPGLDSKHSRARRRARSSVKRMFDSLSKRAKDDITHDLHERVSALFRNVFNCEFQPGDFSIAVATNNVRMYMVLCRYLCSAYDVEYSTEIPTRFLAKMAANFNEYTKGAAELTIGDDYTFEHLRGIELYEFPVPRTEVHYPKPDESDERPGAVYEDALAELDRMEAENGDGFGF